MSVKHPIISVTGSSGAGTTTVKHTFERIFRPREDRRPPGSRATPFTVTTASRCAAPWQEASATGNNHFSHFGPEANLLPELEKVFAEYGRTGIGPHAPLRA